MANGFDMAIAGLDVLRKGLSDRADRRAKREEKTAEEQKVAEKVKGVANLVRSGGLPYVAEQDREAFAKQVEVFGESAFSKILAIGLGDQIPKSAQEVVMQGFYRNYLGKKNGDKDQEASGLEMMTAGLQAVELYSSAQSRGRKLGTQSVGGIISKNGSGVGDKSNWIPQLVVDENGKPQVVMVDKKIAKDVDESLKTADQSTRESLASKYKTKPSKIAENEVAGAATKSLEDASTTYGGLKSATSTIAQEFQKKQVESTRSRMLLEAVDAGYGSRSGSFESGEQALKPKTIRKVGRTIPQQGTKDTDPTLLKYQGEEVD